MMGNDPAVMPDFCNRRYPFHYTTALNLLTRLGVDTNHIYLLAEGEYENYKGEVRSQEPLPGTPLKENTQITLKVGFPSPVDYMPYQFFFGLRGSRTRSAQWEEQSRLTLAPFDASVIRHDAHARYQSLKYSMGLVDYEYVSAFLNLFDKKIQPEIKGVSEALIWATLFPYFHFWAGNHELVPRMLHLLFGYEFQIVENTESTFSIPEGIQYRLGSKTGRLGKEILLGKSFTESDSTYKLIVRGIKPEDINQFLPGKPLRKKLEWVLNICMPNNLACRFRFETTARKMEMGRQKNTGYLGYAAHI